MTTTKNAIIILRNGGKYLTQIDIDHQPPETIAQRLSGGFIICRDARWGNPRTLIINLTDVSAIVLEDTQS